MGDIFANNGIMGSDLGAMNGFGWGGSEFDAPMGGASVNFLAGGPAGIAGGGLKVRKDDAARDKLKQLKLDQIARKEKQHRKAELKKQHLAEKQRMAEMIAAQEAVQKKAFDDKIAQQAQQAEEMKRQREADRLAFREKMRLELEERDQASKHAEEQRVANLNAKEDRRLWLQRKFKAVGWFFFFGPSY